VQIPRINYTIGGKIKYKSISISGEFYGLKYDSVYGSVYGTLYGVNSTLNFDTKFADLNVTFNYSNTDIFPQYYFKSNIAYKGDLFRGKLKLKTGFDLKYYVINYITDQYQTWYSFNNDFRTFPQKNQFIADFYVGARIGRANINLTIANMFNSLVYNAYIFPLDDRGGFGNEFELNDEINTLMSNRGVIASTHDYMDSIARMEYCKLFISNDTAFMHSAAALQIPVVGIFAYTNYKELYPWKTKNVIIRKDLVCSPCFYNSPKPATCIFKGEEEFKCIKMIGVDEVYEAVRQLTVNS
jgi:hypothetical protein